MLGPGLQTGLNPFPGRELPTFLGGWGEGNKGILLPWEEKGDFLGIGVCCTAPIFLKLPPPHGEEGSPVFLGSCPHPALSVEDP